MTAFNRIKVGIIIVMYSKIRMSAKHAEPQEYVEISNKNSGIWAVFR